MAHFQDLDPASYFPESTDLGFKAVGWLEQGHNYSKGEVTAEFFERLCELLCDPWTPPVACGGIHPCQFCRFTGGGEVRYKNHRLSAVGRGFLFIPGGNILFASPSSIAHYIDAHEYCPPSEFQKAVLACPEMKSQAYMRALLETPARTWLLRLKAHEARQV